MSEWRSPTGKRVPHKMRTTAEWLAIYRRVDGGEWHGVTNGPRRQCPVCFSMFDADKRHLTRKRFCSRQCQCVADKARRFVRKVGGAYYTPPRVVRLVSRPVDPATGSGAYLMTNPPFCEAAKTL
jgi:predicted nucleic acid-binding Zn ribbon protein